MTDRKRIKLFSIRVALYLLGMLFLAVSLTLNTKVTLGVSSIISVAYCVSALSGVSIGDTTLVWFILLIAAQIVLHLIRKAPNWKQVILFDVLQLPLSLVFTRFMNLFAGVIPVFEDVYAGTFWGGVWGRLCLLVLAIVMTGVGAALTLDMRLIPNPGDGIVQAIADFFSKPTGTAKNLTDLCCVSLAALISLCFTGKIIGIGLGTLLAVLTTGRVVALFNRLFAARLRPLVPEPAAEKASH
jgi:uncharacterized membrane protein YczE